MKFSDRMVRADMLTDERLLSVSRDARLLAVALESLAEPTGCVRDSIPEIRRGSGWFLADNRERLPSGAKLEAWRDELVAVRWLIEYHCEGVDGLYLKGFGERQRGNNVSIGMTAAGTVAAHLPLPPCVPRLAERAEQHRAMPIHCTEDYANCPCDKVKPRVPEGSRKGAGSPPPKEKERNVKVDPKDQSSFPSGGAVPSGDPDGPDDAPHEATHELPEYVRAFSRRKFGTRAAGNDDTTPTREEERCD